MPGEDDNLAKRLDGLEQRIRFRLTQHDAHLAHAEESSASTAPSGRSASDRRETIHLGTSGEPELSIIIPVHGAIEDTLACLASIAAFPPHAPYEVIVADDASDPDEFASIRSVVGATIVTNAENVGFLRTCNLAARHASGTLLWLLNSDTELTPDSADALVRTFARDARIGAVGSKLVYGDGVLQEAGGIVWRDASAWNYGKGDDPRRSCYDYARDVDYVSAASLMVRADVWDELGGFDESFVPAYYEDTDLCLRVATSGRRMVFQPGSVVVHHEGRSYGTDVEEEGKHHQVLNRERFFEKWAAVLADRRANGVAPERERERSIRHRVLVIDARMLTPDQDSGSLRMQNLVSTLADAHCRCTFLPHNMALDEPYAQALRERGVEVVGSPYHRSVQAFLRARGKEFDVIVLSRLEVAAAHLTDVRHLCPNATVVYDTVDLHFLRLAREVRISGGDMEPVNQIRDDELAAVERSDVTLVCSTVERDLLQELDPDARVLVLGNVHLPPPPAPGPDGRAGLLFVGGFEHPPNVDAVVWFVAEILPLVRVVFPDIAVHIVGSRLVPEVECLADDHVIVHGFVEDLEPLLHTCRVSIAPLRFGAGVKGKVTQSMSMGLPTVGTTVAVEGAPVTGGEDVLVADTAASFADAVIRLVSDDDLWSDVSKAGARAMRVHFGPEAVLSTVVDILEFDTTTETGTGR